MRDTKSYNQVEYLCSMPTRVNPNSLFQCKGVLLLTWISPALYYGPTVADCATVCSSFPTSLHWFIYRYWGFYSILTGCQLVMYSCLYIFSTILMCRLQISFLVALYRVCSKTLLSIQRTEFFRLSNAWRIGDYYSSLCFGAVRNGVRFLSSSPQFAWYL